MRILLTSIILLFFVNSCTYFEAEVDPDIIQRDTFILSLVDVHIADVLLAKERKFDKSLKDTTGKKSYYNSIFKKYKINEYRFNKTVTYYGEHIPEYNEIYKEVIEKLSEARAEVDTLKQAREKISKDSIGAVKATKK